MLSLSYKKISVGDVPHFFGQKLDPDPLKDNCIMEKNQNTRKKQ